MQAKTALVHHTDRDSQYAATGYEQVLTAHGIACSMSRKGDRLDNACVEGFFATLKKELTTTGATSRSKEHGITF